MSAPPPRPARPSSGNASGQRGGSRRGKSVAAQRGRAANIPKPAVVGAPPRGRGAGPRGRPLSGKPLANSMGNSPTRTPPTKPQPSVPPRSGPPVPAPRLPSRANKAAAASRKNHSISIIMHDNDDDDESEEPEDPMELTAPKPVNTTPMGMAPKRIIKREACLARSIICLDQDAFMEQIKAEEEMERRMSMVRHNVPLPTPPPKPTAPPPQPTSGPSQVLQLRSQRSKEAIENFLQQEKEFISRVDYLIEGILQPVRQRKILSSFEIVSLFSSIETVSQISKDIVHTLEGIMRGSYPPDIEDEEIYAKLAEVFTDRVDSFQDYINYASNLPSVPGRILTFKTDHEEFDNVIKAWEKTSDTTMKDVLYQPKQRMGAYSSLLSFIMEQTPGGDEAETFGVTTWGNGSSPALVSFPNASIQIRQISCGSEFCALVTEEMDVWVWGRSNCGGLGLGQNRMRANSPEKHPTLSNIASVSCGAEIMGAITLEGNLKLTGALPDGSRWFDPKDYSWSFNGKVNEIFFASTFSIILTEDKWSETWAWGSASYGQLGLGSTSKVTTPTLIEDLAGFPVTNISLSETNVMALTSEANIYIWGSNTKNATGTGCSSPIIDKPTIFTALEGHEIMSVACGNEFFYACAGVGQFYCWGSKVDGMLGTSVFPTDIVPALKSIHAVDIVCGGSFCVAITQSGGVYSWGNNQKKQTGNEGQSITNPTPIQLLEAYETAQLACSNSSAAALHTKITSNSCSSRVLAAKSYMEENVAQMEEQIRKVENISKLLEIDLSLTNGNDYNIVNDSRIFIMKSQMKVGGMDGQSFMFDDAILLCRKKDRKKDRYEIYQMIYFESCVLGKQSDSGNKFSLEIREAHKANKFVPLEFSHRNERDLWSARIQQQMEAFGVKQDSNKERPPSYVPPAAPGTRPGLQKTISLSNMGKSQLNMGDVQANIKMKTKNFKIPRFSNRAFQKLEKKVVALTEGPLLTTQGASMPIEGPQQPVRLIGTHSSQPDLSALPAIPPNALPALPPSPSPRGASPSPRAQGPPIPSKPNLPDKPSLPNLPSLPAKPATPAKPQEDAVQTLSQIRKILGLSEGDDVLQRVKELQEELANLRK